LSVRGTLENDSQAKLSNMQCSAFGRLEYLVSGHVCASCFPCGVDYMTYNFGSFSLSVRGPLENDSQAKLSNTQCSAFGRLEYLVSGHVCASCFHSLLFDIVNKT